MVLLGGRSALAERLLAQEECWLLLRRYCPARHYCPAVMPQSLLPCPHRIADLKLLTIQFREWLSSEERLQTPQSLTASNAQNPMLHHGSEPIFGVSVEWLLARSAVFAAVIPGWKH